MAEPISTTGAGVGVKYLIVTFIFPFIAILTGAIAHVLEEINNQGWKGWTSALSAGFVAFFSGTMVYTFAFHIYPDYAGGLAGLGGFFGAKSINVLLKVIKITAKEL